MCVDLQVSPHLTSQEKVLSLESELVDLKALVRKKGAEIEQISEVSSKLTKERDDITAVVRQEFADKYVCPSNGSEGVLLS